MAQKPPLEYEEYRRSKPLYPWKNPRWATRNRARRRAENRRKIDAMYAQRAVAKAEDLGVTVPASIGDRLSRFEVLVRRLLATLKLFWRLC